MSTLKLVATVSVFAQAVAAAALFWHPRSR
jgi:hypothetical protein